MENSTRLQYLEAMGINVWISRNQTLVEEPVSSNILAINACKSVDSSHEYFAETWAILEKQVEGCQKCTLCNTRTQTVFGAGNTKADWMLIGEAPGENEDLEGKPFVGNAGLLLTEMIRAIGLERDEVYIANILKCRPPNHRDPKVEEVSACNDYLQQQILLVKPKIILAVGRIAAQVLLKTNEPLGRLRGVVHPLNNIPLVVIYHPAYLLRSLLEKRKVWQDLQFAMKEIQKTK